MGTPPASQELTEGNATRSQTRKEARGHAVAKGATRRRGDLECRRASGRVEPDEVTAGRHDAGGRDLRPPPRRDDAPGASGAVDRKSTRLNSSHSQISYAVFCLKKKKKKILDETVSVAAKV